MATTAELYKWMVCKMLRSPVQEYTGDPLELLRINCSAAVVGEFVDALRQTPNLPNFDDLPPRLMYLVYQITKRTDFHPDAIARAIEEDHMIVRDMIQKMGARTFLDFVNERNILLGAESLQYLAQYSDLSSEEKAPFWLQYARVNTMFQWIAVIKDAFWAVLCAIMLGFIYVAFIAQNSPYNELRILQWLRVLFPI